MFPEMRRKERALAEKDAVNILEKSEYGILCTNGINGYPYGVPVNYVYYNNQIYFHCANGVGSKLENIHKDPKVSFTVVGNTELLPEKFSMKYESVIVFGKAQEVYDERKRVVLKEIVKRYSNDYIESGDKYIEASYQKVSIFEIQIEHMTAKGRR